jgi:hypothetical protein
MNFYCSAVDDLLRNETDQPPIGLILCQTKDRILAEYTLYPCAISTNSSAFPISTYTFLGSGISLSKVGLIFLRYQVLHRRRCFCPLHARIHAVCRPF